MKLYNDPGPLPSSYAGVLRYPDKTVVVFKGTVNDPLTTGVRDWLANFSAAVLPMLGLPGLVHIGFADQLRLIRDDVLADLSSGFTPPLYVTGHIQGAAVAALATKLLEQAGVDVAATYTYAAPFPADGMFAASVKTPVVRLEFGDDIVPHVPLHGLPLPVEMALKATPELKDVFGNIIIIIIITTTTTIGHVPVGTLTYGAPGQPLRVDVSPADEKALTLKRLSRSLSAGQNLFKHHALTNYIGMLS